MLGVSGLIGNTTSGDGGAAEGGGGGGGAAVEAAQESGEQLGGGGTGMIPAGFSEEDKARIEEGERGAGGNRWPRQETIALLKIRSDMDVVFRDASLKGPLWEQVSRKMAELGYHRSAKKCKEKFENVYKYHKRTKDGRSTKPDGKNYRFFDQLEALENITSLQLPPPPPPRTQPPLIPTTTTMAAMPISMSIPLPMQAAATTPNPQIVPQVTVSSTPQNFSNLINASFPPSNAILQQQQQPPPTTTATTTTNVTQNNTVPSSQVNISTSFLSSSTFSSSSSTSSDEDIERRHKRKRKWKDLFERLMKDVIEKQEELQKKFLETLEKRERDRMIREEAWRVQEMARINREHDLLVQERSMAASRESALISFLQKMNDQQSASIHPEPGSNPNATDGPPVVQIQVQIPENPPVPPPAPPKLAAPPPPVPALTPIPAPQPLRAVDNTPKSDNGGEYYMGGATSSRWPKAEVQALINLRTNLDNKYQENGPKGPLWEEISSGMRKIGYNRNAKRCKEKWENINKYFKKVKESNKKRPEDSKTCPYFHQLEALYKEKNKTDPTYNSAGYPNAARPEDAMVPIMARPEQQWPLPQVQHHQQQSAMEEHEGENADQNDHDDDDDDDEEDEGIGYEIVTTKPSSVTSTN